MLLPFYLLRKIIEYLELYEIQCLSFSDSNVAKYLKQFDMDKLIKNESKKDGVMFGSEKFINPNIMAIIAMKRGRLHLVNIALKKENEIQDHLKYGIACHAAYHGYQHIVDRMLEQNIRNYNHIAANAAYGGQQHIVNYMIGLGARDYNYIMKWAAHGGHSTIVQQMLDLGAKDYRQALLHAKEGQQQHIVDQMSKLFDSKNQKINT